MGITEFLDPEFVRDRLDEDLTALRDDVRGVDDRTLTHIYDRLGGMLGTVPAVQLVEELRSGTLTVSNVYGVDAGGTVHQLKVDPTDGRLENYLVEPGGGVIDGRNIRYLTQNDVLGTIGVTKTVQTPRSASFGTIASGFPCDGADQVPGTADVRTLDGFSLGIDADGTVEVSHQIQTVPGGSWREDGVGPLVTNEERISTINHKGLQYRPSLTNMDASSTVSVNIEWMGN